jgi:hypothetical protein
MVPEASTRTDPDPPCHIVTELLDALVEWRGRADRRALRIALIRILAQLE